MAEWFEEWFNTEEYLDVYRHRNEAEAAKLVELILNNVSIQPGSDIIDFACGAGRHSIIFAEKGFNVTALDLSPNLLNIARKRAAELNLKINFINADLRNFCITSKFDMAVNLFTSFGYFENDEENFSLFSNASGVLNENGYFVIDYFNAKYIADNLVFHSEDLINGKKIIQEREIIGNRVIKKIIIGTNGTTKRYTESVRLYSDMELISAIEKSGLKVLNIFGNFNGSKFDLNSSPRIIIISGK